MKVNVPLHDGQRRIISERRRFNVICCGRRWGKSRMAFALALETIAAMGTVAYACPTAEDYSKRWDEACEFYRPMLSDVKTADGALVFRNGARMDWFGLHRDTGIRGNRYHRFIIDEAAHAPKLEQAWTYAIRATLADYKGDAYFMSTPNGGNYFKTLYDSTGPDWARWQLPTYDNPFMDRAEVEGLADTMSSIAYRQEILAEFVDVQGARVKREWLRYGPHPDGCSYVVGVDLAASQRDEADYTAIVVTAKDAQGTYYVVDVIRTKATFNDILRTIKAVYDKWQPRSVAVEAVQAQQYVTQELARQYMMPVQPVYPNRDKVSRFMSVEGKIEHGHVVLAPHLIREFEDELLSFPHGQHDDMVDALVYSLLGHDSGVRITRL